MQEHPIIFSSEMVRAIIEGRKTQTRRVIKEISSAESVAPNERENLSICCPYGQVGDRLWVREKFLLRGQGKLVIYAADLDSVEAAGIAGLYGGWKPSIHMPRWASRLTLAITEIRVQRVWEISEEDAKAEGANPAWLPRPISPTNYGTFKLGNEPTHKEAFKVAWDSINAKRGYEWDKNVWVWDISFRKV